MSGVTLYRPVGEKEMELIIESDYSAFPPRMAIQPIFYPVLNEEYATHIASVWNTNDEFGNYVGIVTRFTITKEEFNKHEVHIAGSSQHSELWVPAEKLDEFNQSIIGKIEVVKVFIGKNYKESKNKIIEQIIKEGCEQ